VTVSLGCLWRTLDRLGLRLKKSRFVPPTRKASAPSAPSFIDETWIATNMIRGYGRSPRGERLVGAVPYGHWKTTTFVAGLRCDGLTAPFVIVDRSTANGSAPMSRRCSHRRCGPATSSSWTISARTRSQACARPSRRAAPGCSACRPIRQTSTRSSSSSPSSRHSCARPPPGCALLAMPRRSRRRSACAANAVLVVIPAGGGYHLVQTA